MRLSARYAWPIIALCVAAGIPVAVHTSGRLDRDDCADPGALRATSLIPGARPASNRSEPGNPHLIQLSQGTLTHEIPGSGPLAFAIVRSFDPIHLMTRPERFVTKSFETSSRRREWVEHDGQRLPIQHLTDQTKRPPRFVSLVYVYQGTAVERPGWALLRAAPRLTVRGARPLTLLAVGGAVPERGAEEAHAAAQRWLFDAWDHYRRRCQP